MKCLAEGYFLECNINNLEHSWKQIMNVNNLNLVCILKQNLLKLKITDVEIESETQVKNFPHQNPPQRRI